MKRAFLPAIVVLLLITVTACHKSENDPKPQTSPTTTDSKESTSESDSGMITFPAIAAGDTSNTLVSYTSLVGEWDIVTDTVSFKSNRMYHGKPGDSYRFTRYGNLYVSSYTGDISASVYGINGNKLQWFSPQLNQDGVYLGTSVSRGVFEITKQTSTELVLTLSGVITMGPVYEQIVLKKAN